MTDVMQSVFITTVPLAWEGQIDSLVSPDTGQDRWKPRAFVESRLRGSWRDIQN